MIRRTVVALVLIGAGVALAAPAQADPQQVCVHYGSDRRAICVELGQVTPGR